MVSLLIRSGADVDAQVGRGVTPLHLAALDANPSIVASLVEAGADRDLENQDGATPIQVAARHGHEEALLPQVAAE